MRAELCNDCGREFGENELYLSDPNGTKRCADCDRNVIQTKTEKENEMGMTRAQAILIVLELANENRIGERESEPDLVIIREEQNEAFALLEAEPLK